MPVSGSLTWTHTTYTYNEYHWGDGTVYQSLGPSQANIYQYQASLIHPHWALNDETLNDMDCIFLKDWIQAGLRQ